MRQSFLFTKTLKEIPKDEASINAQLLLRAGFIDKLTAGVYTFLPLGLKVLQKIQNIIREGMAEIGAQEVLMPALTPRDVWEQTGRWDEFDVLFRLRGREEKEYALGATHEEIITPLLKKFVQSYKDLPRGVYQIQDKFRNEARAKSGLLRGREFSMNDLYSFHATEEDLDNYYERMKEIYLSIFRRCDLSALVVEASGGVFSKFSHEFQVITAYGEDRIWVCDSCDRHQNNELVDDPPCPYCGNIRQEKKAIEVGNIFKLNTRFSKAFDFAITDQNGARQFVIMGCYGIGPSRLLGAIVEANHDENGIIWNESVAPYDIHLISLATNSEEERTANDIYEILMKKGHAVLFDDREGIRAGEKFTDSDLIGIPKRVVVSAKTIAENMVEVKVRKSGQIEKIPVEAV